MTKARGQVRRRASRRNRIEVWRIILWSGLTNLVLLSVFYVAQHIDLDKSRAVDPKGQAALDPLMINPANASSAIDLMSAKHDFSPSTMTVAKTEAEPDSETADDTTPESSAADRALAAGASTEDSETLRTAPILRKSPQGGRLEIGNFKSLSLVGSAEECVGFGNALLKDAGVDQKLDVLTAVNEITIARICADNGSVIITCRGGQIAVSPRKSRPDDRCVRKTEMTREQ